MTRAELKESYAALPLPTTNDESWRFTDLKGFDPDSYPSNGAGDHKPAGAMLDVYEHYRLEPGHPLSALYNVILTPHLAAVTQESRARASVAAADEMLRILRGERPRNLVNPEVWK